MLFETVKIENGQIINPGYHNNRMNHSRHMLFGETNPLDIRNYVVIPDTCRDGIFRCRVDYAAAIEKVEITSYKIKNISTLKVVFSDGINYNHKYSDRSAFDTLLERKEGCDDIIIVKNSFVTDASFANLVFFDGNNWLTPSTPLLPGTKRQYLLDRKVISEAEIRYSDLQKFSKVSLINAMRDPDPDSLIKVIF